MASELPFRNFYGRGERGDGEKRHLEETSTKLSYESFKSREKSKRESRENTGEVAVRAFVDTSKLYGSIKVIAVKTP
jgi:hypothetical protein